MSRKKRGGRARKSRQGGGHRTKAEKDAQLSESMAKVHELFIKMDEQFKGCTISGVAIDSNSGAVCIHVEEHNKVLMFYAKDIAIAEHAGKLEDMLLNAGFVVPEVVQRSWNQEVIDMITTYTKGVISGQEDTPEGVDADMIKSLLGPCYKPEEAAEAVAAIKKDIEERREAAKLAKGEPVEEEPEESQAHRVWRNLHLELADMPEEHADYEELRSEVKRAWDSLSDEEQAVEIAKVGEPELEPSDVVDGETTTDYEPDEEAAAEV